jgi:hypothetical protein
MFTACVKRAKDLKTPFEKVLPADDASGLKVGIKAGGLWEKEVAWRR